MPVAKEAVKKILQAKLAVSGRAFRTGEDSRLSIVEALRSIHQQFQQRAERRARHKEKVIECRSFRDYDNILTMYLVGFVPDDSVGIVPHNQDDLDLLDPPQGADFLDGELMALISDEVVIVLRLGLFETALNSYIEHLGPRAGLNAQDASFIFMNRTDVDKLRLIEEDGVAEIRFDGAANQHAVDRVAEGRMGGQVARILSGAWREIKAIAHIDDDEAVDAEDLKVEVFLKFDKRSGTEVDQRLITEVAESVAAEDGGFRIRTKSGKTITAEDVLLNKVVSLRAFGKSVAFEEVRTAMLEYHEELTRAPEIDGAGDE